MHYLISNIWWQNRSIMPSSTGAGGQLELLCLWYRFDHRSAKNEINMYECCNFQVIIINELQKGSPGCKYIPYPAVSAHIGITFPVRSKAWALATATLALCTMTTSKTIIAHFRTPGMQKGRNIHTEIQFSNKTAV
jgi:hypothetical protein